MATRLIVGCGYVGFPVAKRWLALGDTVFAVTRRQAFAVELRSLGFEPIVWNWYDPDFPKATGLRPETLDTVLVSVSHAAQPDMPPADTHVVGLRHLEQVINPDVGDSQSLASTKWIYLSTTGVFGGMNGEWLDEESGVAPLRPGTIAALAGEDWIRSSIKNHLILRPAGIYGPNRVPNWQAVRDRQPLSMDPLSYLNLIHLSDLVETIIDLADRNLHHSLFCVCDGNPPTRHEYYEYIARLGAFPSPIFDAQGEGKRSRSETNKRIRSQRLLSELERPLQFPSYQQGLDDVLGALISQAPNVS
jgi:nucleoside-diphosphate-sugar epimerase